MFRFALAGPGGPPVTNAPAFPHLAQDPSRLLSSLAFFPRNGGTSLGSGRPGWKKSQPKFPGPPTTQFLSPPWGFFFGLEQTRARRISAWSNYTQRLGDSHAQNRSTFYYQSPFRPNENGGEPGSAAVVKVTQRPTDHGQTAGGGRPTAVTIFAGDLTKFTLDGPNLPGHLPSRPWHRPCPPQKPGRLVRRSNLGTCRRILPDSKEPKPGPRLFFVSNHGYQVAAAPRRPRASKVLFV